MIGALAAPLFPSTRPGEGETDQTFRVAKYASASAASTRAMAALPHRQLQPAASTAVISSGPSAAPTP